MWIEANREGKALEAGETEKENAIAPILPAEGMFVPITRCSQALSPEIG